MKKYIYRCITALLPAALIAGAYIATPSEISIPENARYSAYPNGFVRLTSINTAAVGETTATAQLFGALPIKTVQVSVVPEEYVTVSGEVIGVRIYSDGIMVVGVESTGGARAAGIKKGDVIETVNGTTAVTTEQLSAAISATAENTLTVRRGKNKRTVTLCGEKTDTGYTAGMWVRDSAAGIGTMSFVAADGRYGALGHAICDSDTEQIVPLSKGTLSNCRVSSVKTGTSGEPGELIGAIGSSVTGTVLLNTELGLYGKTTPPENEPQIPVATRFLVKEGAAELWCDVDGTGVKSYKIEIENITKTDRVTNKSMTVHITDEELLGKTGGIVQGMSGAPIVQNGRFVGAVTHVFVNDPTRGYAVFAESMFRIAEKLP